MAASNDKLDLMFSLRKDFMDRLENHIPGTYPSVPIDLSTKENQQICRDIALRGVEEIFEALQHLKNWKPHKLEESSDFDRDEFLEEVVDSFNYFFSLILLAGFDQNDLMKAYKNKHDKIIKRIDEGY